LSPVGLKAVPSLELLRDSWAALASETTSVFSTWEWASTWWRHYGQGRELLTFVYGREDTRVTAVLPLYLWASRPVRVARFIGHGPADQLGPVCAGSDRNDAIDALLRVASEARLDLLLLELLPGQEGWGPSLGSRVLRVESSPTLSLAGGWENYIASRSANLRQQIRRRERRLARGHAVRFRLANDPRRLQDDITLLFALHRARWGNARSAFTRWEGFHREFAAVALERGWLRLWFLELDDEPVGAWYGFRFSGVESYYQAGRDPSRSDDSVGFVLLAHSIREAAVDGMREYRFLRGAEPFKLRFADADPGLETYAVAHGVGGKAAAVAAAAGLRSDKLRSALSRIARFGQRM
jgi:CelD/BcsL family acetyltransferase involved in cellulose biosynthesis